MNPDVSVIVPVYNVEKYLNQCITSLLKQTLTNIEIILVDELFNKEKVTIKEMIDHDWNYSFINSKIEERRRISVKFIEENIK